MEGGERIGCANDTISGVMSELADDEEYGGKHVSSYGLEKALSANAKTSCCSKKNTQPDRCEISGRD